MDFVKIWETWVKFLKNHMDLEPRVFRTHDSFFDTALSQYHLLRLGSF